jgi:hypothetical protein
VAGRITLTTNGGTCWSEVAGPEVSAKLPEAGTDRTARRFTSHNLDLFPVKNWPAAMAGRHGLMPLVTWGYPVKVGPGAGIAHRRGDLRVADFPRGVVEVFAAGERLPPYHVETLRAVREVWVGNT